MRALRSTFSEQKNTEYQLNKNNLCCIINLLRVPGSYKMDFLNFCEKERKVLILLLLRRRKRKLQVKISRRFWVRNIYKQRKAQGAFNNLVAEMRLTDHETFFNFYRMAPCTFDDLLSKVGPLINNSPNYVREPISSAEKLSITLR